MSDAEPPKRWRPQPSPIAPAFRGRPAVGKLYCLQRVEDITRHRRRAFGRCCLCRHAGPIHPFYLNFRFGRPLDQGTPLVQMQKRLACSRCGNRLENWIVIEAAEGEEASTREPI